MKKLLLPLVISCLLISACTSIQQSFDSEAVMPINESDDGFRGIWYHVGNTHDEYQVKYGGGLGTYPSNHYPFSVYVPKVKKTFFCYGGTDKDGSTLYHEVAFFDHTAKLVSRPTIVLDKSTNDAHDNPVIQVDKNGYIWLFSTSHGVSRPSFVHRSTKPYDISSFVTIYPFRLQNGNRLPLNNFSYLQIYYSEESGFTGLFTHYESVDFGFGKKSCRFIASMTSPDGIAWSERKSIANIQEGHYQTSGRANNGMIGTSFNFHPVKNGEKGLDYRTNLYYLCTNDQGKSWQTAAGLPVNTPLTAIKNPALIHNYAAEGLNVYINDLNFDPDGKPIILYEVGKGHKPGPRNGRKQWLTAYWTGNAWQITPVTTSDHNYDMGSLYVENGLWKIIAPTTDGPQAYNSGGEITVWTSADSGKTWIKEQQLTSNSEYNHSYPRRPVNVADEFYAFWADGNGREPSGSRLYFSDKAGNVYQLPKQMDQPMMKPARVDIIYAETIAVKTGK